jgi:hypothetical protein
MRKKGIRKLSLDLDRSNGRTEIKKLSITAIFILYLENLLMLLGNY